MSKTILIVDDEKNIANILDFNLRKEGFNTIIANDGETAVDIAYNKNPDLILLDVMLPSLDGFGVCKKVRKELNTPIIMLTARDEEVDKVLGLEFGADDYMTKPFSPRELMARIKANLRRTEMSDNLQTEILKFGNLTINCASYEVKLKNKVVEITLREFELLKFLAQRKGQVFTRECLLEKVWGYEYFGDVRTVDVTVRRIREKIEQDPANPKYIMTKRGVGYYFRK